MIGADFRPPARYARAACRARLTRGLTSRERWGDSRCRRSPPSVRSDIGAPFNAIEAAEFDLDEPAVRQSVFGRLAGYEDVNDASSSYAVTRRCTGWSAIGRSRLKSLAVRPCPSTLVAHGLAIRPRIFVIRLAVR